MGSYKVHCTAQLLRTRTQLQQCTNRLVQAILNYKLKSTHTLRQSYKSFAAWMLATQSSCCKESSGSGASCFSTYSISNTTSCKKVGFEFSVTPVMMYIFQMNWMQHVFNTWRHLIITVDMSFCVIYSSRLVLINSPPNKKSKFPFFESEKHHKYSIDIIIMYISNSLSILGKCVSGSKKVITIAFSRYRYFDQTWR